MQRRFRLAADGPRRRSRERALPVHASAEHQGINQIVAANATTISTMPGTTRIA